MELAGFHHLALKAADVARVAAFYRDTLGLPELRRHEDALGLRSIWLTVGEGILMVERAGVPGGPAELSADPPGLHLLALRIGAADREAWAARLDRAGHPVVHRTAYTLYVRDPEGNRVGLSSWPEGEGE